MSLGGQNSVLTDAIHDCIGCSNSAKSTHFFGLGDTYGTGATERQTVLLADIQIFTRDFDWILKRKVYICGVLRHKMVILA